MLSGPYLDAFLYTIRSILTNNFSYKYFIKIKYCKPFFFYRSVGLIDFSKKKIGEYHLFVNNLVSSVEIQCIAFVTLNICCSVLESGA